MTYVERILESSYVSLQKSARGGNVEVWPEAINMCKDRVARIGDAEQSQCWAMLGMTRLSDLDLLKDCTQLQCSSSHY